MNMTLIYVCLLAFILPIVVLDCQSTNNEEHLNAKTKAIRDYLTLCPSIDICTVSREDILFRFQPCCLPCNCSEQCGYDCCPDGPQTYMTESEIILLKRNDIFKCIKPSLKRHILSTNWPFYEMMVGCPYGYSNETVKEKCLRPFEEFDLGDNVWNVPITINRTRVTYKNLFCAVCNEAPIEESIIWNVVLQCFDTNGAEPENFLKHINFTSVTDIPNNIPVICDILFGVPELQSHGDGVVQCAGTIDRCNVTGEWTEVPGLNTYHAESACLSYRSEYKDYRNIHCFLCNGGNFSNIDDSCGEVSFGFSAFSTRLFVTNAVNTTEGRCNFGFVYDESTQTCRQLHCSKGFVYDGAQCVPFLQYNWHKVIYYVYDVTLTFEPAISSLTNRVTAKSIDNLESVVKDDVKVKLGGNRGADTVTTCDSLKFVKFNQSPNDLVGTLQKESRGVLFYDVMYIAFSFRVSLAETSNVTLAIQDFQSIYEYNDTRINVKGMSFLPASRMIGPDVIETVFQLGQNINVLDRNEIKSLGLHVFMEEMLIQSRIDPSDGLAITPLSSDVINQDCVRRVGTVDADVFCPSIELDQEEFTRDGSRVLVKSINSYVQRERGHFGSGWTTFRMCSESYMKIVKDGLDSITSGSKFTSASLPFVCVYLVLAMIGMSM